MSNQYINDVTITFTFTFGEDSMLSRAETMLNV